MAKWGGVEIPQIQGNDDIFKQGMSDKAAARRNTENNELQKLIKGAEAANAEAAAEIAHKNAMEMENQKFQYDKALKEQEGRQNMDLQTFLQGKKAPALSSGEQKQDEEMQKKIAAYRAGGGKEGFDLSVQKLRGVLESAKGRGAWDQLAGGLATKLGFGGLVPGSNESKRETDVVSEGLGLVKQTDPNPAQKTLDMITASLWDPLDSTENNRARVNQFIEKKLAEQAEIEKAIQMQQSTGFTVNPGLGGPTQQGAGRTPPQQDPEYQEYLRLLEEEKKSRNGGSTGGW